MPAEYDYIKNTYLRELIKIQEYYQSRVYAVKNQNFFVRLLGHVDTPMDYRVDRYVEVTRTRAPFISKAFRMTSAIDYGDVHPGVLFGPGTDEILIYEDSYFDPVYAEKNWKRISALNVMWHPRSDLGFMLPNGKATSTDTGIAVATLNIPLLAVQFRAFLAEQRLRGDSGMLGATHFVHMYVLPNAMYGIANITIANRMIRLLRGLPMGTSKNKHPFPIVDYSDRLDGVLVKLLNDYGGFPMEYEWLLGSMPSFTSGSMDDSMMLPEIAPTRQVWWALMLSRLEMMRALIEIGGEESVRKNGSLLNRMRIDLKRLLRENIYDGVLPYTTSRAVAMDVEWLLSV